MASFFCRRVCLFVCLFVCSGLRAESATDDLGTVQAKGAIREATATVRAHSHIHTYL